MSNTAPQAATEAPTEAPAPRPPSRLLTLGEAAEILEVSDESVRRWARDGLIPGVVYPSGRVKVLRSAVERIAAGNPL